MNLKNQITEEINNQIIRISTETYESNITSSEAIITGLALPFNKISRNGFKYLSESIKENYSTIIGKPVLFNHDPNRVIGHVTEAKIGKTGMEYKMDIDPEEKDIVRKLKRKDLSNVSIQCIYDDDKSFVTEEGVTNAYINEFLELSVVTLPGFGDTTAQVSESFKVKDKKINKGENMSEDKKVAAKEEAEQKPEPKPEDKKEEKTEETKSEEKCEEPKKEEAEDDPIKKVGERIAALEKRIASLEKAKEQADDEEKEEPKKEQDGPDEDEEDKKREEAIAKDKQTVATETVPEQKIITTKDFKKIFMEDK